jgi:hypothetical protein
MKPFTTIAVVVFAVIAVVHVLRLFAGWEAGGLALMVWREARK